MKHFSKIRKRSAETGTEKSECRHLWRHDLDIELGVKMLPNISLTCLGLRHLNNCNLTRGHLASQKLLWSVSEGWGSQTWFLSHGIVALPHFHMDLIGIRWSLWWKGNGRQLRLWHFGNNRLLCKKFSYDSCVTMIRNRRHGAKTITFVGAKIMFASV